MIKRIRYSLYKNGYSTYKTVPESYDKDTKTIEVIFPEQERVVFKPSEWSNTGGNYRQLKGYQIKVYIWGTGAYMNFAVEAISSIEITDEELFNHGTYIIFGGFEDMFFNRFSKNVYETINGYGIEAKKEAIRRAKELAATGLYNDISQAAII